jgi:hypothetical protein
MIRPVRAQKPCVLARHVDLLEPKVTVARLVFEILRSLQEGDLRLGADAQQRLIGCWHAASPGSS